ncbi:MAG TPA: phosphoribosylamine--glycine ligase [Longimicrobium sp.]
MKVLIVGNGGREHALLWKLRRDAPDAEFFVTRPNGGMAGMATGIPIAPGEMQSLAGWVEANGVDLTVVGPEVPLAAGFADHFIDRGLAVFGPTRAAAQIESSKSFAKSLMVRHKIPTAAFHSFDELGAAEAYIRGLGAPVVVKASGLAAGKGAVVCESVEDALAAAAEMLGGTTYGAAGSEIVVEEFMRGEELSLFVLCDGKDILPMIAAQDHKRIGEGETGPNTGGMGAYAPVSIATPDLLARVESEILRPTVAALADEKRTFRGLLYAGLMLTEDGPKVVEFNCRFGDPETQAVLPLLRSSLLEPVLEIARGGSIAGARLDWHGGAAATTVLASAGYPGDHRSGDAIHIPAELEGRDDVIVFHGGTTLENGELRTSGGRVLAVTGMAPTLAEAAERSRAAAESISFEGKQFRRDIGWREMGRAGAAGA